VQITGDQALLPDELDRALHVPGAVGGEATAPRLVPELPAAAAPPTVPEPAPAGNAAGNAAGDEDGGNAGGTAASGGAAVAEPVDDVELVRAFYENLPGAPAAAFDLLAPELLDSSLGEFLQSWSGVVAIDSVDVEQRADEVLATVRMTLRDGGHLRVRQLLTVAESPRRIVAVRLLSAQRD
jgi:hypothetical protein